MDAKYYFIYHIDVYEGENIANIDIQPLLKKLSIKNNYDANDIIKSGIMNNPHGSRHLYMENQYSVPQLFY